MWGYFTLKYHVRQGVRADENIGPYEMDERFGRIVGPDALIGRASQYRHVQLEISAPGTSQSKRYTSMVPALREAKAPALTR